MYGFKWAKAKLDKRSQRNNPEWVLVLKNYSKYKKLYGDNKVKNVSLDELRRSS